MASVGRRRARPGESAAPPTSADLKPSREADDEQELVSDLGLSKKQLAETIGLTPEALYKSAARRRGQDTRRACAKCWKS